MVSQHQNFLPYIRLLCPFVSFHIFIPSFQIYENSSNFDNKNILCKTSTGWHLSCSYSALKFTTDHVSTSVLLAIFQWHPVPPGASASCKTSMAGVSSCIPSSSNIPCTKSLRKKRLSRVTLSMVRACW